MGICEYTSPYKVEEFEPSTWGDWEKVLGRLYYVHPTSDEVVVWEAPVDEAGAFRLPLDCVKATLDLLQDSFPDNKVIVVPGHIRLEDNNIDESN